MTTYWCELAWLGGERAEAGVLVEVEDGRIAAVTGGTPAPPPGARRLEGLTLPGLANAHSHAFQRALRGRTQHGRGSFWTWREQMYRLARPPRSGELSRARARDLRRDGAGRGHDRRRVPLPPPRARRHAVRRPERDGPRADRRSRRGRAANHADRLLLPARRDRGAAGGAAATILRRQRGGLGGAGRGASGERVGADRRGDPQHARGRPRGRGDRGRLGARARPPPARARL